MHTLLSIPTWEPSKPPAYPNCPISPFPLSFRISQQGRIHFVIYFLANKLTRNHFLRHTRRHFLSSSNFRLVPRCFLTVGSFPRFQILPRKSKSIKSPVPDSTEVNNLPLALECPINFHPNRAAAHACRWHRRVLCTHWQLILLRRPVSSFFRLNSMDQLYFLALHFRSHLLSHHLSRR